MLSMLGSSLALFRRHDQRAALQRSVSAMPRPAAVSQAIKNAGNHVRHAINIHLINFHLKVLCLGRLGTVRSTEMPNSPNARHQ
jgi:hypothetical protein